MRTLIRTLLGGVNMVEVISGAMCASVEGALVCGYGCAVVGWCGGVMWR